MRVYLDNCAFNRPLDDQTRPRIRLETEAKLWIQDGVQAGTIELAWSYVLDFENSANPFEQRRLAIHRWKDRAALDVQENEDVLHIARELVGLRLKPTDALHVACAIAAEADYFVTTDDHIIARNADVQRIEIVDPTALMRRLNP